MNAKYFPCLFYLFFEQKWSNRKKNATYLRFSGKWKMKFQAEEMNRRKKNNEKKQTSINKYVCTSAKSIYVYVYNLEAAIQQLAVTIEHQY